MVVYVYESRVLLLLMFADDARKVLRYLNVLV